MTYYVVAIDAHGCIEERGIRGPLRSPPILDDFTSALVVEIADGGTVRYSGPRALHCSAPSRVTVHGAPSDEVQS